jgi:hypothetical protein
MGRTVSAVDPGGKVIRAIQRIFMSFVGCEWNMNDIVLPSGVFICGYYSIIHPQYASASSPQARKARSYFASEIS